jgi:hypothetical protein
VDLGAHLNFFSQPVSAIIIGVLIHLFCVGLPIALVVRRLAKKPEKQA